MAAKKKVVVEIELEVLQKLVDAAHALSELASSVVYGCDDPAVRAKLTKAAKKKAKTASKRR